MADRDTPTGQVVTRDTKPVDPTPALPEVPEGWDKHTQQEEPAIREGATPRQVLERQPQREDKSGDK